MLNVIEVLIPIFLLILLGYFLKVLNFPNKNFWDSLDKFNYFILFPSLLIYKLSTANIKDIENFNFVFITVFIIVLLSLALIFLNKIFKFENKKFASIYQGAVRFNTYVFLAFVDSFYGDKGLVLAAVLMTFMIPLLNLFSIGIFSFYLKDTQITLKGFFKSIFTNPLILACLFGGSINYLDLALPSLVLNSLALLSTAALPLGLLSVGVGLYFSNIIELKKELLVSSVFKLLIKPLFIYILTIYFVADSMAFAIIFIFAAMPTATSSYILAKQLGGDEKLMASIISIQTIVSIFSITLVLSFIQ